MKKISFTPSFITELYLIIMLSVFLLFFWVGGYTTITLSKYVAFLVLTCSYLIALGCTFVKSENRLGLMAYISSKWTPAHWLFGLFWLCCVISAFISPYFPDTIIGGHRYEGILTISLYLVIFYAVSIWGKANKQLLWVFAVSMVIFCVICFLQFMSKNPFYLYPDGLTYYDANVKYRYEFLGTIGNTNLCAGILAVSACVFAVALARLKDKKKHFLWIPFLMVLVVTYLAHVDAGYVGVGFGLFCSVPLGMLENKRYRRFAWIILIVLLILILIFLFLADIGDGTLHEIHQVLHGDLDDNYGSSRLFIWRNVLAIVPDRLLFGGGCDTLVQRMPVEFQRYDETAAKLYTASIDAAHNEYLNILVNEGLLAFLCYICALIYAFIYCLKNSPGHKSVAICGCGVLGYGVQAFFGIRMIVVAPFFWIALALMFTEKQKSPDTDKAGDSYNLNYSIGSKSSGPCLHKGHS